MASLISCPACTRPLQIPEGTAAGQQVRCPACGATFDTAILAVPEGPPPLSDTPSPPPAGGEIQDVIPVAGRRPGPRRPDIEQRPCPECGRDLPVNIHRCPACGTDIDADEDRPWEESGEVRRDWEPHRGGLILALGIISVVLGPVSFCCSIIGVIPEMIGLGLGIAAWVMGRRDLKKMEARLKDPSGQGTTMAGFICGIIGTILCGLGMLVLIVGAVFYGLLFFHMARNFPPPSPPPPATVSATPLKAPERLPFPPKELRELPELPPEKEGQVRELLPPPNEILLPEEEE